MAGRKPRPSSNVPRRQGEGEEEVQWAFTEQVTEKGTVSNPISSGSRSGEVESKQGPGADEDKIVLESKSNFKWSDFPEVKVHGDMFKETKGDIRLIAAAQWRRRFFVLYTPKPPYDKKNSLLMYFDDEVSAQKYFSNTTIAGVLTNTSTTAAPKTQNTGSKGKQHKNVEDLLLGSIDLAALTYFQESYRLDLNHRAMELKTPHRTWVLQVEGFEEFYDWFNGVWKALVKCNNTSVKMNLPNVWHYRMPGKFTYRATFCVFVLAGLWWIYNLLIAGSPDLQPCVEDTLFLRKAYTCAEIDAYGAAVGYAYDTSKCTTKDMDEWWWYGTWNPFTPTGDNRWRCFVNIEGDFPSKPPMYWLFVVAELLNLVFATAFYLGLWRPTRRGARFLDTLNPPFPSKFWPVCDVLICHYSEPAEDTMETVEAVLDLEYPKEKLHVWVCDDGYCKSTFKPNHVWPTVQVNQRLIAETGDVREQLAELVRDRIGLSDNIEPKVWRQRHSKVLQQTDTQAKEAVVHRIDCAVGLVRDDYTQYTDKMANVHYVARMKPRDHHAKAGNINNCLYNAGADGRYTVILDNDMRPHPKFLKATLPLFYCKPGRLGGSIFDDTFTTANMDQAQVEELDVKPLDMPVSLPTVSPAYGADIADDRKNKDLLSIEEQYKLRETCKRQAEQIRALKKQNYQNSTLGMYQPYKKGIKKREKKIFEASAPDDLTGARVSSVGQDEEFEGGDGGGEWM